MRALSAITLIFILSASGVFAQDVSSETVLVSRGDAAITAQDFKAAMQQVPEQHRSSVATDPEQSQKLVAMLLENRLLAQAARERGLGEEQMIQTRVRLKTEQILATELLQRVVAEHIGDADYAQMAEEYYLTHKGEFKTDPVVSVTHVMVGTESRTLEEALKIATKVHDKLVSGEADMKTLVAEYSDDPAAVQNKGQYADQALSRFVQPFADAVKALEPGAISEPVKTRYGYHVIRLDARTEPHQQSLEDVNKQLITRMEKQHKDTIRSRFLAKLIAENPIEADPEAFQTLRKEFAKTAPPAE